MKYALLLIAGLAVGGCQQLTRVQAYERGDLAQKRMQMPPSAVDAQLDDHIYFSKEAARGGRGGGGGGCGCN